jgi:Niemann-Pick C1 protein
MTWMLQVIAAGACMLASIGSAEEFTPIHEAGRCAMRGHCGSKSFFGKQLPCVDNGLAEQPDDDVRKQLVELCGAKWETGSVCCNAEQVGGDSSLLY